MEFKLDDLKFFISTLWYNNVDDYDFLRLNCFFSIEYLLGLNVFLNHLIKNMKLLIFFK
jgi:hypothetical protein